MSDKINIKTGTYDSLEKLKEKAKREGAIVYGTDNKSDEPFSTKDIKDIDAEELWKKVLSMRKFMLNHSKQPEEKEVEARFPEIKQNYPNIFKLVYKGSNLEMIRIMLDQYKKIKSGKISYVEGSKDLGKKMAEYTKNNN